MPAPCKIDPTNPEHRRDAAINMAGKIELLGGIKDSNHFTVLLVKEYGPTIRPYARDMFDEAMRFYRGRANMPLLWHIGKLPGGGKLLDVANKAFQWRDSIVDDVRKVIAPQNRSEDAKLIGNAHRESLSKAAMDYDRVETQLITFREAVERMPKAQQHELIDAIEAGDYRKLDQKMADLARQWKAVNDEQNAFGESIKPGFTDSFQEHYLSHWWDVGPGGTEPAQAIASKKSLAGPAHFRRQREFFTHKDGREWGLIEPKGATPIDYMLRGIREKGKYLAALQTLKYARDNGFEAIVNRADITQNSAWKPLEDKLSAVLSPNDAGEFKDTGVVRVYPVPIADLLNNHVAPGLQDRVWYRGYMGLSNTMNQFRLGLSAFHATFVTGDTMISLLSNSIDAGIASGQAAMHGDLSKAVDLAKISGGSLAKMFTGPIVTAMEGYKIKANWSDPLQHPEMAPIVKYVQMAGGRATLDSMYHTKAIDNVRKAFRQNGIWSGEFGKQLVKSGVPAIFEASLWPIMHKYIPYLKLGVFNELLKTTLAKLPENATEAQVREAVTKTYDSVENRLGQMAYDNLHLNKWAKDIMAATVMAPGWQAGILREGIGAGVDAYRFIKALPNPNKEAQFTRRMAYAVALPVFVMTVNAMLQYISTGVNTGTPEFPRDLRDYMEPRSGLVDENGQEQRIFWPNYMSKEVWRVLDPILQGRPGRAATELVQMASHKLNSPISPIVQLITNEDYQRTEIFSDDDIAANAKEFGRFALKQLLPFSLMNLNRTIQSGAGTPGIIGNFFGIQPLPTSRDRTPFEDALMELRQEVEPSGMKTERQKLHFDTFRSLAQDYRKAEKGSDPNSATEAVEHKIEVAIEGGLINERDAQKIRMGFNVERVVRLFNGLFNDNMLKAVKLAEHLGNEKELDLIYPTLLKADAKVERMAATEDEKLLLRQRIQRLIDRIDPTGEKFMKQEEDGSEDKNEKNDEKEN